MDDLYKMMDRLVFSISIKTVPTIAKSVFGWRATENFISANQLSEASGRSKSKILDKSYMTCYNFN